MHTHIVSQNNSHILTQLSIGPPSELRFSLKVPSLYLAVHHGGTLTGFSLVSGPKLLNGGNGSTYARADCRTYHVREPFQQIYMMTIFCTHRLRLPSPKKQYIKIKETIVFHIVARKWSLDQHHIGVKSHMSLRNDYYIIHPSQFY